MKNFDEIIREATDLRRDFHKHPATAYEEVYISDRVATKLTEWNIPFERNWAVTGIVATIHGKRNSNRAIGFRADMDALDIVETSGVPWSSTIKGKMHACGHDGHTASLLAFAHYLSLNNDFSGKVHLFFQPAEEGKGGAIKMIDQGLFDKFPCEKIFACHNWPWFKRGKIALRTGAILGAIDRVRIKVSGRGGHAASPHDTIDPIPAIAQLTLALQTIVSRNVDPMKNAVVSVTNLNAGTGAENVIPRDASLTISVRSLDENVRDILKERIIKLTETIAAGFNLTHTIDYERGFDATVNDAAATIIAADSAREVVGYDNVDDNTPPWMGAEDFGAMLKVIKGCYILVGQGEDDPNSPHNKSLHHDAYDFNDKIMPSVVKLFEGIVKRILA
jgi:hippurate hydrolase